MRSTARHQRTNLDGYKQGAAAYIDIETKSEVDEREIGIRNYLIHPTTEVCCCAYAMGDGPVQTWRPGETLPDDLVAHINAGERCVAHDAVALARLVFTHILVPRYGWPEPRVEQWHCTAAMAAAMGLTRELSLAAAALEMSTKDLTDERSISGA
jgi:DNA polymerase